MKTISKKEAEYISDKFYDFHDKVWEILKEVIRIKSDISGDTSKQEISLNYYCIARHDKNIIVANFFSSRYGNMDIHFPLHYLYDKNWQKEYRNKLISEEEKTNELKRIYKKIVIYLN